MMRSNNGIYSIYHVDPWVHTHTHRTDPLTNPGFPLHFPQTVLLRGSVRARKDQKSYMAVIESNTIGHHNSQNLMYMRSCKTVQHPTIVSVLWPLSSSHIKFLPETIIFVSLDALGILIRMGTFVSKRLLMHLRYPEGLFVYNPI